MIYKAKLTELPKTGERMRFILVYQGGIANIFKVDCFNLCPFGRNAVRVFQGSYRCAENIAVGMGLAGAVVQSACCNEAGDITNSKWTEDFEAVPFNWDMRPVYFTVGDDSTPVKRLLAALENCITSQDAACMKVNHPGWRGRRLNEVASIARAAIASVKGGS